MTHLETYIQNLLGIPAIALPQVLPFFEEEKLTKGKYFVKEGGYCKKMSFIREGYVRYFSFTEKKEVTHWIFWKDQLITEVSSFHLQTPSKWNIEALTDCELYSISYENYQKLKELLPKWEVINEIILVKCFSSLENRVLTFLSMTAEERYQYLFDSHKEIFNQLPLNYIASILGITPETMSRIRKKLNS